MTLTPSRTTDGSLPSRSFRAAGVYFSILTGLAWLSMILLLAFLVPRLERVFGDLTLKNGAPVVMEMASVLSRVVHAVGEFVAPLIAGWAISLAVMCGRAKSRRLVIGSIVAGAVSMALFLVLVVALFANLYGPMLRICSQAGIRH